MKLRRDPEVSLEPLITIPDDHAETEDEDTLKNAHGYFEQLTAEIARLGKATAGVVKVTEEEEFVDGLRNITSTRTVESSFAKIYYELAIQQRKRADGSLEYETTEGGDDFALAGMIQAHISLKSDQQPTDMELTVGYDQEAAHFCAAILNGTARFNTATGQLWVYVESRDAWMVCLKPLPIARFGYRKAYEKKKARVYWFDT